MPIMVQRRERECNVGGKTARVVESSAVAFGMAQLRQRAHGQALCLSAGSPHRGEQEDGAASKRFSGTWARRGACGVPTQRLRETRRGAAGLARQGRSLHCCGNVYSKKTVGTSALRRALLARFLFRFRKYLSLLSGLRAVLPRICRTAHEAELTAALRRCRRAHRSFFVHPVVDGAEDISGIC